MYISTTSERNYDRRKEGQKEEDGRKRTRRENYQPPGCVCVYERRETQRKRERERERERTSIL